ncbi:hypothetical protein QJQ45_008507 [Haematococcus lacustris]|nr:hypothetical protein QJQ45_008507 [Haematococcus lacustris]
MRRGGQVWEARLLQRLSNHPNLQVLYGWSHDNFGNEYMVLELALHGSLDELLQEQGHSMRTADRMKLCEQVCFAMRSLAAEGITHGDLAARNVLVHSTQPWIVKVTDFGLARLVHDSRESATFLDTGMQQSLISTASQSVPVRWAAPEVLLHGAWSEQSDVWAFGVLMWEIYSNGEEPYVDKAESEVLHTVLAGQQLPRPASCPAALYQLMQHCWALAPADRPTFTEVAHQLQQWRVHFESCSPRTSPGVTKRLQLQRGQAPPGLPEAPMPQVSQAQPRPGTDTQQTASPPRDPSSSQHIPHAGKRSCVEPITSAAAARDVSRQPPVSGDSTLPPSSIMSPDTLSAPLVAPSPAQPSQVAPLSEPSKALHQATGSPEATSRPQGIPASPSAAAVMLHGSAAMACPVPSASLAEWPLGQPPADSQAAPLAAPHAGVELAVESGTSAGTMQATRTIAVPAGGGEDSEVAPRSSTGSVLNIAFGSVATCSHSGRLLDSADMLLQELGIPLPSLAATTTHLQQQQQQGPAPTQPARQPRAGVASLQESSPDPSVPAPDLLPAAHQPCLPSSPPPGIPHSPPAAPYLALVLSSSRAGSRGAASGSRLGRPAPLINTGSGRHRRIKVQHSHKAPPEGSRGGPLPAEAALLPERMTHHVKDFMTDTGDSLLASSGWATRSFSATGSLAQVLLHESCEQVGTLGSAPDLVQHPPPGKQQANSLYGTAASAGFDVLLTFSSAGLGSGSGSRASQRPGSPAMHYSSGGTHPDPAASASHSSRSSSALQLRRLLGRASSGDSSSQKLLTASPLEGQGQHQCPVHCTASEQVFAEPYLPNVEPAPPLQSQPLSLTGVSGGIASNLNGQGLGCESHSAASLQGSSTVRASSAPPSCEADIAGTPSALDLGRATAASVPSIGLSKLLDRPSTTSSVSVHPDEADDVVPDLVRSTSTHGRPGARNTLSAATAPGGHGGLGSRFADEGSSSISLSHTSSDRTSEKVSHTSSSSSAMRGSVSRDSRASASDRSSASLGLGSITRAAGTRSGEWLRRNLMNQRQSPQLSFDVEPAIEPSISRSLFSSHLQEYQQGVLAAPAGLRDQHGQPGYEQGLNSFWLAGGAGRLVLKRSSTDKSWEVGTTEEEVETRSTTSRPQAQPPPQQPLPLSNARQEAATSKAGSFSWQAAQAAAVARPIKHPQAPPQPSTGQGHPSTSVAGPSTGPQEQWCTQSAPPIEGQPGSCSPVLDSSSRSLAHQPGPNPAMAAASSPPQVAASTKSPTQFFAGLSPGALPDTVPAAPLLLWNSMHETEASVQTSDAGQPHSFELWTHAGPNQDRSPLGSIFAAPGTPQASNAHNLSSASGSQLDSAATRQLGGKAGQPHVACGTARWGPCDLSQGPDNAAAKASGSSSASLGQSAAHASQGQTDSAKTAVVAGRPGIPSSTRPRWPGLAACADPNTQFLLPTQPTIPEGRVGQGRRPQQLPPEWHTAAAILRGSQHSNHHSAGGGRVRVAMVTALQPLPGTRSAPPQRATRGGSDAEALGGSPHTLAVHSLPHQHHPGPQPSLEQSHAGLPAAIATPQPGSNLSTQPRQHQEALPRKPRYPVVGSSGYMSITKVKSFEQQSGGAAQMSLLRRPVASTSALYVAAAASAASDDDDAE